jgi:FlaA1/EpsC-like NDP-sugar epimerase
MIIPEPRNPLTVTEPSMKRFLMSIVEWMDAQERGFPHAQSGELLAEEAQHR